MSVQEFKLRGRTRETDERQADTADRRLFRRYDLGLPAEVVHADGSISRCAISDLSLGGVAISPTSAGTVGEAIRLRWDGLYHDKGLCGAIVSQRADSLHISFELDDDSESALTMFLVTSDSTR